MRTKKGCILHMSRRRREEYHLNMGAMIAMIIMAMIILLTVGSVFILSSANNGVSRKVESLVSTEEIEAVRDDQQKEAKTDGKEVSVEGEIVAWGQGKSLYEEMKNEIDENEKSMQEMVTGDYVLPNSGTVRLQESDLAGLSQEQLRIARNEILARHGRKFGSGELQAYFESKPWYNGTLTGEEFDEQAGSLLSPVEQYNIDFILSHE